MILYHGTTQKNGLAILETKKIITNGIGIYDDELYKHLNVATSKGFTYMTTDLAYAIFYANKNSHLERSRDSAYVFKIDISDEFLEQDLDELKMVPEMASVCFRTNRELNFEKEVLSYSKFSLRTNHDISTEDSRILELIARNSSMKKLNALKNVENPLPSWMVFQKL